MQKGLAGCWMVLWGLLIPVVAQAATYYVSTSGSNSNSCATAQAGGTSAKLTLNGTTGGIACLSGGDTLLVQNGVYNEQICDSDADHCPGFTAPLSGASWSAPTVIKAENVWGATLNKASTDGNLELVVNLSQLGTQYVSIENFILDGRSTGASCVWVGPSNHIQIKGNKIQNCGGNGIYQSVDNFDANGNDSRLINNEIHNVSVNQPNEPGTHGIYFTGHDSLIQGNFIYECPFFGIQASSEHGGLNNNIIENNRIYGCGRAGIISQGSNTIVRNNLLENNCMGIWVGGGSKVYNNTIFDYSNPALCDGDNYGILSTAGSVQPIRNNIILQQGGPSMYFAGGTPTLENNLCDGGAQQCQISVGDYTTVVVDGILSASTTPTASNLQLKSGSGAINTGVDVGSDVPTDRLGVTRPQGGTYDIGAYEFVSGGDTTPPTVSITAPSNAATVSGSTAVTANASDNVAVVGVQFKLDGANLGAEDTTSTYGITWDTTTTSSGSHALTAVARDAATNTTTSSTITVTVDNGDTTPPTVSITDPANAATVSGSITVVGDGSDNVGIVGMQFKVDGTNLGSEDPGPTFSRPWNTTTATNGSHALTAVARDAAGNTTTSATITVTVNNGDTTAPTVSITDPANAATVSGSITVVGAASDDVAVVGVQFKIDGNNLGSEDPGPGFSRPWDTTLVSNGSHAITAVARDAAGNTTTSSTVTVTVSNGDSTFPTVSVTAPASGATVSGTSVTVTASASDNVGVVGVQFKLDGTNLGAEDTTSTYGITWASTTTTNGVHTLTAVARDAAGNTTTSAGIAVTVDNLARFPGPPTSVAANAGVPVFPGAPTSVATLPD